MEAPGPYRLEPFVRDRELAVDMGVESRRRHHVQALLELDVTEARRLLRERRARREDPVSLTAWFVGCAARAVAEYPRVQALRKGRRRMVVFREVDVALVVERTVNGEKIPLPYVIRRANEKTPAEISAEILAAKRGELQGRELVLGQGRASGLTRLYLLLPRWLRLPLLRLYWRDPFRVRRMAGTVVVTAVGMFGKVRGWAVPFTAMHPLSFALASVVKKPGIVGNEVRIREYLHLTVLMDHDVVDGAPMARFLARLTELVEGAWGLAGSD